MDHSKTQEKEEHVTTTQDKFEKSFCAVHSLQIVKMDQIELVSNLLM